MVEVDVLQVQKLMQLKLKASPGSLAWPLRSLWSASWKVRGFMEMGG